MVNWYLAGIAGAAFFGGVNIALVIFFRTRDFDEEHRAENQKVVSKLLQEFKETLDGWIRKRSAITDEDHLPELLPELQKLSEIGGMIEKWNSHITIGKDFLHKAATSILAAGSSIGLLLAMIAAEDSRVYQYAVLPGLFGFLSAGYAYKFMRAYLALKNEIARKSDALRLGKPVSVALVQNPET